MGNVFLGTANLTALNYANANNDNGWVLWKRSYSATGDTYSQMAVTELVTNGGAYWLYTKSGGTFPVNGDVTKNTPVPSITFGNQKADTNRYVMYANPWALKPATNPLNFSALLWSGTAVTPIGAIPFVDQTTATVTSILPIINTALVSKNVSYWMGNTYSILILTSSTVATFTPYEAAWIKVFPIGGNVTNATIKPPKPP